MAGAGNENRRMTVGDSRVIFSEVIAIMTVAPRAASTNRSGRWEYRSSPPPNGDRMVILPEAEFIALQLPAEDR